MTFIINPFGIAALARSEAMQLIVKDRAEDVADKLRDIAPYDPEQNDPHYRDSIEVVVEEEDGTAVAKVVVGVPWALEVEFGTQKMAPQAPMRRATDAS